MKSSVTQLPIHCSTGAFSRDPDLTDSVHVANTSPSVDADGFELIFYPSFYDNPPAVLANLRPYIGDWHSLHAEKSIGPLLGSAERTGVSFGLHRLRVNFEVAAELEIPLIVLHMWGLPDSDRHIERNFAAIDECLEIADEHGVTLSVETIPCLDSTPLDHIRAIRARAPQMAVTLDTEFLAMHAQLEAALGDHELMQAVRNIHLKDFDGNIQNEDGSRRYLHPGEGAIDFNAVLQASQAALHPPILCLESPSVRPNGSVDIDRINADLRYIRSLANQT